MMLMQSIADDVRLGCCSVPGEVFVKVLQCLTRQQDLVIEVAMENLPMDVCVFTSRVRRVVHLSVVSADEFPVAEQLCLRCVALDRNQGLHAGDQEVRQLLGTCRMLHVDDGEHVTSFAALN